MALIALRRPAVASWHGQGRFPANHRRQLTCLPCIAAPVKATSSRDSDSPEEAILAAACKLGGCEDSERVEHCRANRASEPLGLCLSATNVALLSARRPGVIDRILDIKQRFGQMALYLDVHWDKGNGTEASLYGIDAAVCAATMVDRTAKKEEEFAELRVNLRGSESAFPATGLLRDLEATLHFEDRDGKMVMANWAEPQPFYSLFDFSDDGDDVICVGVAFYTSGITLLELHPRDRELCGHTGMSLEQVTDYLEEHAASIQLPVFFLKTPTAASAASGRARGENEAADLERRVRAIFRELREVSGSRFVRTVDVQPGGQSRQAARTAFMFGVKNSGPVPELDIDEVEEKEAPGRRRLLLATQTQLGLNPRAGRQGGGPELVPCVINVAVEDGATKETREWLRRKLCRLPGKEESAAWVAVRTEMEAHAASMMLPGNIQEMSHGLLTSLERQLALDRDYTDLSDDRTMQLLGRIRRIAPMLAPEGGILELLETAGMRPLAAACLEAACRGLHLPCMTLDHHAYLCRSLLDDLGVLLTKEFMFGATSSASNFDGLLVDGHSVWGAGGSGSRERAALEDADVPYALERCFRECEPGHGMIRPSTPDMQGVARQLAAVREELAAACLAAWHAIRGPPGAQRARKPGSREAALKLSYHSDLPKDQLCFTATSAVAAKAVLDESLKRGEVVMVHPKAAFKDMDEAKGVCGGWATPRMTAALQRYEELCAQASEADAEVCDRLRGVVSAPDARKAVRVTAEMAMVIEVMFNHIQLQGSKKWTAPTVVDSATQGPELQSLWPYWMEGSTGTSSGEVVVNDVHLTGQWLLTGPNTGGKSTFMRALAAAALLAQWGFRVPAESATFPRYAALIYRCFDGDSPRDMQSAFSREMEEINETLTMLASDPEQRALLALDEFGRGTDSVSGTSFSSAVVEEIDGSFPGVDSVFATHHHRLEGLLSRAALTRTSVKHMGTRPNSAPVELPRAIEDSRVDLAIIERIRQQTLLEPSYKLEDGWSRESLALKVQFDEFTAHEREALPRLAKMMLRTAASELDLALPDNL